MADKVDWVVLLVDDTPDNLVVAEVTLKYHGATVHKATSGHDAIAMLETIQPTVILLDIRMPDMDGFAVFDHIRNDAAHAHIPIIAVTAYAMQRDEETVMEMGFDGYISKPFDVTKLVDSIKTTLENKSM